MVGAGLSGLMSAVAASESGARVALVEKQALPGRKYLMAAMGSGALTNTRMSLQSFHGREARFVADALAGLDADALKDWLAGQGVALSEAPHYGLVVPDGGPWAVLAALAGALGETDFLAEARVANIRARGGAFQVQLDDGRTLGARKVILATGGANLPQLGGEVTGAQIARGLGHGLAAYAPLHVAVRPADAWLSELVGLWMDVKLTLRKGQTEIASSTGSMLFVQGALTGEAVFNLGPDAARAMAEQSGLTLVANFFPELERADVAEWLYRTLGGRTQLPATEALDDMLPRRLGDRLLARQRVKHSAKARDVEKHQREGLLAEMTGLEFGLVGTLGDRASEAALGGINVREINPRSMESRVQPGLYVVGQLLDVSADWGGMLQHFALASGRLGGHHAAQALRDHPGVG